MEIFRSLTKLQIILISLIFLTGTLLRFIDLGKIPSGLTNDEANVGYDAYSILKTGKDQWGMQQPSTYLKGFGDYRPPVYTYAVIPSIQIFGLNEFAVRFPSALAGSLTLLSVFFLASILWNNTWVGIFAMFFLAFNPWHMAMSRVGIESNFGVFIVSCALSLFLLGLKNTKLLYGSMILLGLTIYTYTSYVVLAPIFLLILFFVYKNMLLKNKRSFFVALGIFLVMFLPLLIGGSLKTASVRSKQVNLTSDIGIINLVNDKRGECQTSFNNKICQIVQNKYDAFISTFVFNYLNHFSPELLVSDGTTTQFSALPQRGLLYITEYLFFFFGILFLMKRRKNSDLLVLFWILLTPLPDSITSAGHYSRFMPIIPALQLASAFGLYSIIFALKKRQRALLTVLIPIVVYEILAFISVYWTYFPRFYAQYSHYGYKTLMQYVSKHQHDYTQIIISSQVNDTKQYVFYLFFNKYDPAKYQSGKDVEKLVESDGWVRIKKIGNVLFLPSLPPVSNLNMNPSTKILLAGAQSEFPKKTKFIYTVKDPKNNVIFGLKDLVYESIALPSK